MRSCCSLQVAKSCGLFVLSGGRDELEIFIVICDE